MTRSEALVTNLRDTLAAGERLARGLREVMTSIAPHMPLSAGEIDDLGASPRLALDAFLLRFANLAVLVNDQLLRAILLAEQESLDGRSRRDALNLATKLGALRPDVETDAILTARHRIAHVYPNDPGRQAALVNQVYETAPTLISMLDGFADYVRSRHLAEG